VERQLGIKLCFTQLNHAASMEGST